MAELGKARADNEYPSAFRRLTDEALEGVEGEFVVLVDPADVDLAVSVLDGEGLSAEFAAICPPPVGW